MIEAFKKLYAPFILGFGIYDKIKLFWLTFFFTFKRRFGLIAENSGSAIRNQVQIKFGGNFFDFYPVDGSDLSVLREIFIEKQYDTKLRDITPEIIFDIGSNVGASIIYFKLKYPRAKIYAFEPDPENFQRLKENIRQFDNIQVRNFAISDTNGPVVFFIHPQSAMSSSLKTRQSRQKKITVNSKTLGQAMEDEGIDQIDLVKFDVEGAEFDIFFAPSSLPKIKCFLGEVHEDIAGKTVENFLALFPGRTVWQKKQTMKKRYIVELS